MAFKAHYVSIEGAREARGTAVVLDVLRAFTTAAWAFALGAERILLTDSVEEALRLKAHFPGALAMKDSTPLPGFELSNSPVELQAHEVRGRTIVQRTTHGTVGAVAAYRAGVRDIYCASFVNAKATAAALRRSRVAEAYFIVTAEQGTAEDDLACAEYIAALAGHTRLGPKEWVDPAPFLQRVAESGTAGLLRQRVADGVPGVHQDDLAAAMDVDRFDFVMQAREEYIDDAGAALVLHAYNQFDA